MNTSTISSGLKAESLSCIRDTHVLFEDLSFSIDSGEILVIEGRNGCGKTSLLRILSGIRQQDEGRVSWGDTDIQKLGASYREDMAYLGHLDGIKHELSAVENLELVSIYGKVSEDSIDDALETIGLTEKAELKAVNLSAGQKRRLALARLLLTDCKLWLLDEPLTALDKAGIALFEQLVKAHVAEGGLVVLSSHHDLDLANTKTKRINLSA